MRTPGWGRGARLQSHASTSRPAKRGLSVQRVAPSCRRPSGAGLPLLSFVCFDSEWVVVGPRRAKPQWGGCQPLWRW